MRAHELDPAIDGKRRFWRPSLPVRAAGRGFGHVCCYVAEHRRGRPILFVHDLRTTSSAYEMRPLFEFFRWRRPTFAIDLPGFGLSDRGDAPSTVQGFATVLSEMLQKLREGHGPVDVVALGRGSEAAAMVACAEPGLVRSLALVAPYGLFPGRGAALASLGARVARATGDLAARGLFRLMVARPVVARALRRRFYGKPDDALVAYSHASANAPGAHLAPLEVLATPFETWQIADLYRELTVPVLVIHDAGGSQALALEAFLRGRANRFASRISPTRGMPQFERPRETAAALERFWQPLAGAAWDQAMR
jgi:pimeloyl-ACP methyl ester carboxylesterase